MPEANPSNRRAVIAAVAGVLTIVSLTPVVSAAATPQQPAGYEQILPRGGIPAIDSPEYVSAAEADIRDEAWVLGVLIDGQARAYSLALLNGHEVVNDSIGDVDFAAVW